MRHVRIDVTVLLAAVLVGNSCCNLIIFPFSESQRNTAPFFVVNMLLMLLAAVFHVVGVVRGSAQTLIGGIIYIVAGNIIEMLQTVFIR